MCTALLAQGFCVAASEAGIVTGPGTAVFNKKYGTRRWGRATLLSAHVVKAPDLLAKLTAEWEKRG